MLHHFRDIIISKNLKRSRDHDDANLRDNLSIRRLILHMANQCTKFEVSSLSRSRDILGGLKIYNESRDVTTPLSGQFVIIDLLCSNCTPNLKSLCSPTMKILKPMQNAEIGVVWEVRGHPRSLAMSAFDRAHTTSCSTLIETMRISCTVFKL